MSKIVERAKVIATEYADKLNLEIVDVEWVKENHSNILRIIADTEVGLTIDESVSLNEAISIRLDEEDFIEEDYMLEVSSPGIERPLKNDQDIINAIDKYIFIKTYSPVDGIKEFTGYLKSYIDGIITISVNNKGRLKEHKIEKSMISKIRLAVKF
jgi:ribosome maturation factor RimP